MGLFDIFKKKKVEDLEVDLNKRNYTYLNHIIQNSEKEVILDSNITLDEEESPYFKDGIIIKDKQEFILDGNGHTIDASNKTKFFTIDRNNSVIHFKNIHFKNGYVPTYADLIMGVCIKTNNAVVKFTDCIFENNCNLISISNEGYFSKCTFENNQSCFVSCNTANLSDCIFRQNDIIISIDGKFNIENCRFINNSNITRKRDLVDNRLIKSFDLEISNSIFENNGSFTVRSKNVSFLNCCFKDNHSEKDGGAIYMEKGKCLIKECKFIRNHSSNFGGAIFNCMNSTLKVYDSCFKNNRSEKSGGAIYNDIKPRTSWETGTNSPSFGDGVLEFSNQGNTYSGNKHKKYENGKPVDGEYEENTVMDLSKNIVL